MNGLLLLNICLFGFASAFLNFFGSPKLVVTPKEQTVFEHENAVIDCIVRGNGTVYWTRPSGFFLPRRSKEREGRLIIRKIELSDDGIYICETKNKEHQGVAHIQVLRRPSVSSQRTYPPVTEGIPTTSKPSWTSSFAVNTPYPCLYGVCNGTCCGSNSMESFFDCANGQKINKSLVCNRANDCEDGSDESRCDPWESKITVLPKQKVEVYCGDEAKWKSGTLILECESVGHPTPVIRWKKYDGLVPSKCQQYSKHGHGILTCPDFQQSDQGAYSCVAENSVKSAESQPKSIAKCSNTIYCSGFKVVNEEQIEHCLDCYCSGRTTQCQNLKSNPTVIKIPFPESQTEIFAKDDGEILFIPTKTNLTPNFKTRESSQSITYCSLSDTDFTETSLLKSFGRNIIIPKYKGKTDFIKKAPDLIIQGNGLSLMYTTSLFSPIKDDLIDVTARFWPGNWYHLNKEAATRKDIMTVLSNIESLLIRCEYQQGQILNQNKNKTISIESSTISHFTNSVSYVEKCNCPSGYDGLSCETCADGYTKKSQDSGFICEKIDIPTPCEEGYIGTNCTECDTIKGYHKKGNICSKPVCHSEGSVSIIPNFFDKCECKEGVTGDTCDRCKNDSFYLHKARGCLKCWCSGVTDKCTSSNLYRTVISNTPRGGYNASDGRNFWLLPSDFSGNRLTSYGGHLNYTMKFKPGIPREKLSLTVEFLCSNDVTLVYSHPSVDTSITKDEKSWSVPLIETNWRKSDKSLVTRGEFLSVLSKIKAIYVESPYHLSSGQANLTSTRMTSTSSNGDFDSELALEVEKCFCPQGYTGLSCESCSEGYYKKRNGTVNQCIKCNCSYCDPEFGCADCPQLQYRDNPEDERIPVCKPCPCNGNGVSCVKDDHNQIFCRCKPGFTGMQCENSIPEDGNDLLISISPRRITGKKVGTTVHYNCTLISSEEMTLTAEKRFLTTTYNDSNILSRYGKKISEKFSVVLEAGMEAVECVAKDADGKLAGRVVSLVKDLITFVKPVRIIDCYSERIDIKESEGKDIICQATGIPTPMVNWYKMVEGLPAEKVDTSEGVHTIESASLSDNGTIYTCVAENSEGDKATCTKVLVVRKKCEVINIIPKQVNAKEGDNFTIQCKTTAKSPVFWSEIDPFFQREKLISSSRVKVNGSYLQFTNAEVSDSGTYICTTTGESGKINQTVPVVIKEKRVPPTVYIPEYDKTLKEGESFHANCIATGKPTPVVTWTKVNGTLDTNINSFGKTLTINKAILSNTGIYQCEARSSSGNASSYISIEVELEALIPRINISEETLTAHEGDEVSLSCLAIGYPRPQLSWFSPNIDLTNIKRETDNMILIEPQESVKETVRFKVTKEMEGTKVTCQGSNKAGMDQKFAVIKVLQFKGEINETVEFVQIGSYFELSCEFSGSLEWEKVGGKVGDECPIPNALMIQSVQIQHNGTYICKEKGTDSQKIINIIVIGFVPKFSKTSKSYLILPVQSTSAKDIRIELSFNSQKENGVLLFEENSGLVVCLKKGQIHLSHKSNNKFDIVLNKAIRTGRWYSLVVSVDRKYVDLTVYDEETSIHERMTEESKDLISREQFENFFVGGLPKKRHREKMFWRMFDNPHFDGCISRLSIDRHEFDMVKEGSFSHNVTLCGRCSETTNPCSGKGKCLDAPTQYGFICVCPNDQENCPAGCAGKLCETQLDLCRLLKPCSGGFIHSCHNSMYSLRCQCAYGYSGTTCEKVQEYSFCSRGNGYVKLPSTLLQRRFDRPEIIKMSFTLEKSNGQLLWQGEQANHLSIAVRGGQLEYSYLNQHSKLQVTVSDEISLNKKHSIVVKRNKNSVVLELSRTLSSTPEVYRNSTPKVHTNRVSGDIYLGHVPNNTHHIGHRVGLNGCIHYVAFGDNPKINLPEKAVEKFNVFLPKRLNPEFEYYSEESNYSENESHSNEILTAR